MATATRIEVLDPTVEPIPAHAVIAPRPETLDGTVIGLLANGKHNSGEILEMVQEILADRFEFKGVVFKNKGNASRPCPKNMMGEMVDQCDVVITASGD
jgi:hypothetical protein